MSMMHQVVFTGPGQIELEETVAPTVGAGEVLVRTTAVGICGSDLHALAGTHPFIDLPCRPGHEVVGVVEEVSSDVTGVAPGDRVIVEPGLVCGKCRNCREGRYNICDSLLVFGCQTRGAMSERFTIAVHRLHRIPDDLTDAAAALVEPLSTGTHAVRLAGGDLTGQAVAVLGAGSIGLLTMLAARAAGAKRIVVTDLLASKRERAQRLGADAVVDAAAADAVAQVRDALDGRADITFDCVANQPSTDQALHMAEKGGMVMVVGVPTASVQLDLPMIQDREIAMKGALMYTSEDVVRAVELMRSGQIPVEEIVTATFPLTDFQAAFDAALSGDHVKVHLVPA
jgi:L-iditol 2-dehydrogenase